MGADKAYDTAGFVAAPRDIKVMSQVVQDNTSRRSAIDGRTIRQPGYAASIRIRKRIEEVFGWVKTSGAMRETRHCGQDHVGWAIALLNIDFSMKNVNRTGRLRTPPDKESGGRGRIDAGASRV